MSRIYFPDIPVRRPEAVTEGTVDSDCKSRNVRSDSKK